ncbi:dephospho-CoA kinase [Mycoplasma iguanae]|uniref:Dephospho-CoA kinase n=1 Tax=Mycoplasma iguanae TaxID=292461 RepID=A0ABY5R8W5_9MOLU|nr:dephospho-CoA kinase [Mycoplasma iguanae]UVD81938.1 dephospho-CoA kinase [Mycoplasma iguanae]
MKKQYAIIGNYGVGKSYLLKRIASLGYSVLEADIFFRECYKKNNSCYLEIQKKMGNEFINENEVDREKLRKKITVDNDFKNKLEKIVYPFLEKELSLYKYDFVEIPNVFSKNANFEQFFTEIFELFNIDEKQIENNVKKKGVNKFISDFNANLNQKIFKKNNVKLIDVKNLETNEQLKMFLRKTVNNS